MGHAILKALVYNILVASLVMWGPIFVSNSLFARFLEGISTILINGACLREGFGLQPSYRKFGVEKQLLWSRFF